MATILKVKVLTSDNKLVELEESHARKSGTIQNILDDNTNDEAIPLPNVDCQTMEHVVTFLTYSQQQDELEASTKAASAAAAEAAEAAMHNDGETDINILESRRKKRVAREQKRVTDEADQLLKDRKNRNDQFLGGLTRDDIFKLILAANYLNIRDLLDVTAGAIANMLKNKTPQEIRDEFNIANDFTPEEEEQVRMDNQWAFEM